MESSHHQYICDWNDRVYIYTNDWSMRRSGFIEHSNRQQRGADVPIRADFSLSECNSAGAADNF
jgi:hypothetical protein